MARIASPYARVRTFVGMVLSRVKTSADRALAGLLEIFGSGENWNAGVHQGRYRRPDHEGWMRYKERRAHPRPEDPIIQEWFNVPGGK